MKIRSGSLLSLFLASITTLLLTHGLVAQSQAPVTLRFAHWDNGYYMFEHMVEMTIDSNGYLFLRVLEGAKCFLPSKLALSSISEIEIADVSDLSHQLIIHYENPSNYRPATIELFDPGLSVGGGKGIHDGPDGLKYLLNARHQILPNKYRAAPTEKILSDTTRVDTVLRDFQVKYQCDHVFNGPYLDALFTIAGNMIGFRAPSACSKKSFNVDVDQIKEITKTGKVSHVELDVNFLGKQTIVDLYSPYATTNQETYADGRPRAGIHVHVSEDILGENTRYVSDLFDAISACKEALAKERSQPSGLELTPVFDDSQSISTDGKLEAGKAAILAVRVENKGPGKAYGVKLVATPETTDMKTGPAADLGNMEVNATQTVNMPVQALLSVGSGQAGINFVAEENRGFNSHKVRLVIPTVALVRPALRVDEVRIIDDGTNGTVGNGNGIIESGETVNLMVSIRNDGPGPAYGATATATNIPVGIQAVRATDNAGVIAAGSSGQARLTFMVPRSWTGGSHLPVTLKVADGRGDDVASASETLSLQSQTRFPILSAQVHLLANGKEVSEITNGQSLELEVIPENSGSLDAADVTVTVSSPGIEFRRTQSSIATLRAGEQYVAQRFELILPRKFESPRAAFLVQLKQRDFAASTISKDMPVHLRVPMLKSTLSVADGSTHDAVEQNRTARVEVHIENAGGIPAENVVVKINSISNDGVVVQGSSEVRVGEIAPKDVSVARFTIRTKPNAQIGSCTFDFSVTQQDFSVIAEKLQLQVRAEEALTVAVQAQNVVEGKSVAPHGGPEVIVAQPGNLADLYTPATRLVATISDVAGITGVDGIQVSVNGVEVSQNAVREGTQRLSSQTQGNDVIALNLPVDLTPGGNAIRIRVRNNRGEYGESAVEVHRLEADGKVESGLIAMSDVDSYILSHDPAKSVNSQWALVIGIEKYKRLPDALYARRDALAMKEYFERILGVPESNIFTLLDDNAAKTDISVALQNLSGVGKGDTVFVYFAGHGTLGENRKQYILPYDGAPQPRNLDNTAYRLEEFYHDLAQLGTDKVVVFMDSCFSGKQSRSGSNTALVLGSRPVLISDPMALPENIVGISSSSENQTSNAYEEQAHGLFTYYLLKGLERIEKGKISMAELSSYVTKSVADRARTLPKTSGEQKPTSLGRVDNFYFSIGGN